MKIKTMKELQGMLATFVENGCYVDTFGKVETLYDWLEDHNYIPIGKIKLKHGFDEKRYEELEAYGDLFRKFDADVDEPFNRLLWHSLETARGETTAWPIMTGFTPYQSNEMEVRLEF